MWPGFVRQQQATGDKKLYVYGLEHAVDLSNDNAVHTTPVSASPGVVDGGHVISSQNSSDFLGFDAPFLNIEDIRVDPVEQTTGAIKQTLLLFLETEMSRYVAYTKRGLDGVEQVLGSEVHQDSYFGQLRARDCFVPGNVSELRQMHVRLLAALSTLPSLTTGVHNFTNFLRCACFDWGLQESLQTHRLLGDEKMLDTSHQLNTGFLETEVASVELAGRNALSASAENVYNPVLLRHRTLGEQMQDGVDIVQMQLNHMPCVVFRQEDISTNDRVSIFTAHTLGNNERVRYRAHPSVIHSRLVDGSPDRQLSTQSRLQNDGFYYVTDVANKATNRWYYVSSAADYWACVHPEKNELISHGFKKGDEFRFISRGPNVAENRRYPALKTAQTTSFHMGQRMFVKSVHSRLGVVDCLLVLQDEHEETWTQTGNLTNEDLGAFRIDSSTAQVDGLKGSTRIQITQFKYPWHAAGRFSLSAMSGGPAILWDVHDDTTAQIDDHPPINFHAPVYDVTPLRSLPGIGVDLPTISNNRGHFKEHIIQCRVASTASSGLHAVANAALDTSDHTGSSVRLRNFSDNVFHVGDKLYRKVASAAKSPFALIGTVTASPGVGSFDVTFQTNHSTSALTHQDVEEIHLYREKPCQISLQVPISTSIEVGMIVERVTSIDPNSGVDNGDRTAYTADGNSQVFGTGLPMRLRNYIVEADSIDGMLYFHDGNNDSTATGSLDLSTLAAESDSSTHGHLETQRDNLYSNPFTVRAVGPTTSPVIVNGFEYDLEDHEIVVSANSVDPNEDDVFFEVFANDVLVFYRPMFTASVVPDNSSQTNALTLARIDNDALATTSSDPYVFDLGGPMFEWPFADQQPGAILNAASQSQTFVKVPSTVFLSNLTPIVFTITNISNNQVTFEVPPGLDFVANFVQRADSQNTPVVFNRAPANTPVDSPGSEPLQDGDLIYIITDSDTSNIGGLLTILLSTSQTSQTTELSVKEADHNVAAGDTLTLIEVVNASTYHNQALLPNTMDSLTFTDGGTNTHQGIADGDSVNSTRVGFTRVFKKEFQIYLRLSQNDGGGNPVSVVGHTFGTGDTLTAANITILEETIDVDALSTHTPGDLSCTVSTINNAQGTFTVDKQISLGTRLKHVPSRTDDDGVAITNFASTLGTNGIVYVVGFTSSNSASTVGVRIASHPLETAIDSFETSPEQLATTDTFNVEQVVRIHQIHSFSGATAGQSRFPVRFKNDVGSDVDGFMHMVNPTSVYFTNAIAGAPETYTTEKSADDLMASIAISTEFAGSTFQLVDDESSSPVAVGTRLKYISGTSSVLRQGEHYYVKDAYSLGVAASGQHYLGQKSDSAGFFALGSNDISTSDVFEIQGGSVNVELLLADGSKDDTSATASLEGDSLKLSSTNLTYVTQDVSSNSIPQFWIALRGSGVFSNLTTEEKTPIFVASDQALQPNQQIALQTTGGNLLDFFAVGDNVYIKNVDGITHTNLGSVVAPLNHSNSHVLRVLASQAENLSAGSRLYARPGFSSASASITDLTTVLLVSGFSHQERFEIELSDRWFVQTEVVASHDSTLHDSGFASGFDDGEWQSVDQFKVFRTDPSNFSSGTTQMFDFTSEDKRMPSTIMFISKAIELVMFLNRHVSLFFLDEGNGSSRINSVAINLPSGNFDEKHESEITSSIDMHVKRMMQKIIHNLENHAEWPKQVKASVSGQVQFAIDNVNKSQMAYSITMSFMYLDIHLFDFDNFVLHIDTANTALGFAKDQIALPTIQNQIHYPTSTDSDVRVHGDSFIHTNAASMQNYMRSQNYINHMLKKVIFMKMSIQNDLVSGIRSFSAFDSRLSSGDVGNFGHYDAAQNAFACIFLDAAPSRRECKTFESPSPFVVSFENGISVHDIDFSFVNIDNEPVNFSEQDIFFTLRMHVAGEEIVDNTYRHDAKAEIAPTISTNMEMYGTANALMEQDMRDIERQQMLLNAQQRRRRQVEMMRHAEFAREQADFY